MDRRGFNQAKKAFPLKHEMSQFVQVELERKKFVDYFTKKRIANMTLDEYAEGKGIRENRQDQARDGAERQHVLSPYGLGERSEPVPIFFLTSAKPFSRHSQTLEAQSERGASVNEGKSRVKGSEEIPNVNEESIRFLRGL